MSIRTMASRIHGEKRHWLGRRPGHQGPCPISGSQGTVKKWTTGASPESEMLRFTAALRATENNKIQLRKVVKVGTWNVRSLIEVGKLDLLELELGKCEMELCGLSDV